MENLNLTYSKNLNKNSLRSWDIRVAEITGSLNAALLYGQIAHHHKYMGDFSKSNQELSKELSFSVDTIKRLKNLLIKEGFISIQNGFKNKTVYSIVKKLDYFEKSYRRYDINHCLINKDVNSGILLSYLIYCHEHFSKKDYVEFFKTNESLMNEVYLSSWQLNEAKKKLIANGFIMTRLGQYGRTYYTINMTKIKESVGFYNEDSGCKRDCATGAKPAAQPVQNQPRNRCKTRHIIYNKDINNIYLGNEPTKLTETDCESGLDRQIKEKKLIKDEQPPIDNQHHKTSREVAEKPSVVLWTNPLYNPEKLHQKLSKCNLKTNQSLTKGVKKMENNEDVTKMIDIWNETIKKDKVNPLVLTEGFKQNLQDIFESKFYNSLETWQEYCTQISLDDFRMGKKPGKDGGFFNINLTWALKDESINNILLIIMEKKSSKNSLKDITPSKEVLIKEVLSSSDSEWLQKLKVVLIDCLHNERGHYGLQSYQSYLRNATFELSVENNKKKLIIKSFYNAYNNLFIYNELIAKAIQDFDEIVVFDGIGDKRGNYLYLERKSKHIPESNYVWNKICREYNFEKDNVQEMTCAI